MRILMLTGCLCLLTACDGFSAAKVEVPAPPSSVLTAPCADLQRDPGRALMQAEVEIHWARDRAAARACSAKHAALAKWVQELVEILKGEL